MSKALDEILDTHINEIKAGHNDKLEQEILQWAADEVIGEDEQLHYIDADSDPDHYLVKERVARNELKEYQRNKLKELGWKEVR